MLPYSMALLAVGTAMVIGWVALDLPLGPGAGVQFDTQALLEATRAAQQPSN